ncbi:MAG: DUF4339 domain-containing protein [Hyphomonadaceae bacterium]
MALDAASETWWVNTNQKVYGPYTRQQMARFLAEGRVTQNTLVSLKADGDWSEARYCRAFRGMLHEDRTTFRTAERASASAGAPHDVANVLVYAEFLSGGRRKFEYELHQLGAAAEITPTLWLVRTRKTAGALRNTLSQMLERGDKMFVLDATRDRLAWFNLGPETDVRLREVWNAPIGEHAPA